MEKKGLKLKFFAVIFSFALLIYFMPGCGGGGSSGGGGDDKSPAKASKSSGKKPIASFIGHVNLKTGELTFEYPDDTSNVSGKKLYTSQPPGSGLNVTLSS